MSEERDVLKRAILGLLDAIAQEHPLGHQPSKGARYILRSRHGVLLELMIEKNEDVPPNIWCLEKAAGKALIAALRPTLSPKAKLWPNSRQYGRHSALRAMPQLGEADLVYFAPTSLAQVGQIIDRLRAVTASDIS